MITRVCKDCGKELPLEKFATCKRNKLGKMYVCRSCVKNRDHKRYLKDKDRILARTAQTKKELGEWFLEIKKDLKCEKCGETHPACLQFHHLDPSKKEGNISGMFWRKDREHVLKEIEKCIVLCANCHFKVHYEEKQNRPVIQQDKIPACEAGIPSPSLGRSK